MGAWVGDIVPEAGAQRLRDALARVDADPATRIGEQAHA